MALRLVFLSALVVSVAANSRGIGIPCNVDQTVGSDDVNSKNEGIPMWWAKKAAWAGSKYTLRSGDGAASDTTSYTPGVWTEIFIRTNEAYQQYTGLVLYAEDASGDKVGEWLVAPGSAFHQPGECVTHKNANRKKYLETFRVKLPKGTGSVTIKALVKYGLANPVKTGGFFWPNNAHLTLSEGTPAGSNWFQGSPGQSCDVLCNSVGGTCDLAAMNDQGDNTQLYNLVKERSSCFLPLMAGCSESSPAITADGCYFHDDACDVPVDAPLPERSCSGNCPNKIAEGECCTWNENEGNVHNAGSQPCDIGQCCCLDEGTQVSNGINVVYSEYSGTWSPGWADDYVVPTQPPPPSKEALSCSAVIDWNGQGRRLCACAGATSQDPPTLPPVVPPTPPPINNVRCLNQGTAVTVDQGLYLFDGEPYDSGESIGVGSGVYYLADVPTTHPISIKGAGASINAIGGVATDTAGYYTGDFVFQVFEEDFGTASYDCEFHGPMGGANRIVYSPDCALRGKTPTAPPTPAATFGTCSKGDKCLGDVGCCAQGLTCFEKDEHWASCDPDCVPGVHPDDPVQYQTDWSCAVLSPPPPKDSGAPTAPPTFRGSTPTVPPTPNTKNDYSNGAARCARLVAPSSSSGLSLALLSTLLTVLAGDGGGAAKLGAVALGLAWALPSAEAHNWCTSPARGNEAGENNGFNGFQSPPGPQRSSRIHVQVGAGQRFPVEWAAGHGFGSHTYFAVTKASDEKMLDKHSIELLDAYLAAAPSTDYLSEFPVHHVARSGEDHGSDSLLEPTNVKAAYHWVPSVPSSLGVRPAGFRDFGNSPGVWKKTGAARQDDQRAKYFNAQFPWIISAHKFLMRYDYPADADTTMLEIPAGLDPGRYLVHYLWSGYYDIIDVQVLDSDVDDLWGEEGASSGYDRTDHCQFIPEYEGYQVHGCLALDPGDGVSKCVSAGFCVDGKCDTIQVASTATNDKVSLARVALPAECDAVKGGADMVCFALTEGTPVIGPTYIISADPEDSVFYDSCFRKSSGWTFSNPPCEACGEVAAPEPGWVFGSECITCSDMRMNSRQGGLVPRWDFTDQCRSCDADTQGR